MNKVSHFDSGYARIAAHRLDFCADPELNPDHPCFGLDWLASGWYQTTILALLSVRPMRRVTIARPGLATGWGSQEIVGNTL